MAMETPLEIIPEDERSPGTDQPLESGISTSSLIDKMGLNTDNQPSLCLMIETMKLDVKQALEEVSAITTHDTNLEKQYNEVVAENQRLEAALKRARRQVTSLTGRLTLLEMAPAEVREEQKRQLLKAKRAMNQDSMLKAKRVKNFKFNFINVPSFQDRSRTVNHFGEYIDHSGVQRNGKRQRNATYPASRHAHMLPAMPVKADPLPPSMAGCSCSVCNTEQSLGSLAVTRKLNKSMSRSRQQVLLGDRVIIRGEHLGTVKYIGKVEFDHKKQQTFIGVHLDAPVGIHDGEVKGRRYFNCPPTHGVLVRPSDIYSVIGRKVTAPSTTIPRIREGPLVGKKIELPPPNSTGSCGSGVLGSASKTPTPDSLTRAQTILRGEMEQLFQEQRSPSALVDSSAAQMSKRMVQLKHKQVNKVAIEETDAPTTDEDMGTDKGETPDKLNKPKTPPTVTPPRKEPEKPQEAEPTTDISSAIMEGLENKDLGSTGFVTIVELRSVLQNIFNLTKEQVTSMLVELGFDTSEGKGIKYDNETVQRITEAFK